MDGRPVLARQAIEVDDRGNRHTGQDATKYLEIIADSGTCVRALMKYNSGIPKQRRELQAARAECGFRKDFLGRRTDLVA